MERLVDGIFSYFDAYDGLNMARELAYDYGYITLADLKDCFGICPSPDDTKRRFDYNTITTKVHVWGGSIVMDT